VIKLLRRLPLISRLPARFIGLGFLPEHVETEDVHKSQDPRP
jgi:hypothetical protein